MSRIGGFGGAGRTVCIIPAICRIALRIDSAHNVRSANDSARNIHAAESV
jgi:hypothetical protein